MGKQPQLPERKGQRPQTSTQIPHTQLDQNAPSDLQEALWSKMTGLSQVDIGQSIISVPGARATFVSQNCQMGPSGACMIDREFAHIHPPADGSLHVTLARDIRNEAIEKGWAEPHPLVATGQVPETVVMIYGPRDAGELETVWSLVQASHALALGNVAL